MPPCERYPQRLIYRITLLSDLPSCFDWTFLQRFQLKNEINTSTKSPKELPLQRSKRLFPSCSVLHPMDRTGVLRLSLSRYNSRLPRENGICKWQNFVFCSIAWRRHVSIHRPSYC